MASLKAIYAQTQQRQQPVEQPPPPYTDNVPETPTAAEPQQRAPQIPRSPRANPPSPDDDDSLEPDPQRQSAPQAKAIPFTSVTSSAPSTAQRARAPLAVKQTNSAVNEDFVILRPSTKTTPPPDVFLKTTNGKINSTLWAEPSIWQRPFAVTAETTNGSINLSVMTMTPGQAVDVRAQTSNSQCNVFLPNDFHGRVKMCTTNSTTSLSPFLQARSVRVPAGPREKDEKAVWYEIGGSGGPSFASLWSTNSKVRAATLEEREAEKEAGCMIM